jgi:murein DD-endopeptidase MepM/ murein hydrolase activator NlpD
MAVNTQRFLPSSGGASATTRPTATLVPYKKPSGGALVKQQSDDSKEEEITPSLEENVAAIRVTTKKIEKIIGRTLKLNKDTMRFEARTNQKNLREEKEKKRENKKKKGIKMPKGINIPGTGFLDGIRNFLGTIILGRLLVLLVDYAPKIAEFVKFISPIAKFIGDVVSGLADKLVTAIDFGYKVKDKIEETTKNLFGDDGLKKFKEFQGHFTKFMNLAMIAIMLAGTTSYDVNKGRRGGGGNNLNRRGVDADGFKNRTGNALQTQRNAKGKYTLLEGGSYRDDIKQRYTRRFGEKATRNRFGAAASNVSKKVATKGLRAGVGKIAGKIPIVGPLIDFGIRAFIFKEPLGKAAAGAVGAGVGQALGTWLGGVVGGLAGSVVPIVGNLLGAAGGATLGGLIGGVIGDQIGVSLYNVLTNKEDAGAVEDASLEAKEKGGVVGKEEYESEREKRARNARIQKIMPSSDQHMKVNVARAKQAKGRRGNIFNRLFSFMTDAAETVTSFVNPFDKIKDAVKKLRSTNSGILSKIMALGADLIAGKKPDARSIKAIVKTLITFFDAAIPAPIGLITNILQKLANGGYVLETPQEQKKRTREFTKIVERKFLQDATRDTTRALNVIKGIKGETDEQSAARRSGGTNPTTPLVPGGNRPASAGATLSGSDKLGGVSGTSGSVAINGAEQTALSVSYTPFAESDIQKGGVVITSAKGYRRGTNSTHNGYDIAAPTDTPMYAYLDGEVTHANATDINGAGYGYWIVWKDSVHGAYHFFGHLHRPPALGVGAKFKAGALLGNVGSTGRSTGPHLHWEISNSPPAANGQFSSYLDPGNWVNTHGAQKKEPQITPPTPTTTPDDISSKADYEITGTVIAVHETTKIVRVPVRNRRGRKVGTKNVTVHKDATVIAPT